MIRHVIIALTMTLIIVPAHAGEVLDSYRPHMRTASDWADIPWWDQVEISKEIATTAIFNGTQADSTKINACMDIAASDIRHKRLPFDEAVSQCVKISER